MEEDFEKKLTLLMPHLLKFARLQLRNDTLAEDVLQETLLAAIQNKDTFRGDAQLKTWLIAILKNKILDVLRLEKYRKTISMDEYSEEEFHVLFDQAGHWNSEDAPGNLGDPVKVFEQARFWEIFELCMTALPDKYAQVFSMNEFLGVAASEICKELHITLTNYWVLMHRSRMQLRLCLEKRWLA